LVLASSTAAHSNVRREPQAQNASNTQKAAEEARKGAEQGDAKQQAKLALYYYYGIGVGEDHAEAAKWYQRAAEQGDAASQCNLGGMYLDGKGVPQNYAEAAKWYRKAAENETTERVEIPFRAIVSAGIKEQHRRRFCSWGSGPPVAGTRYALYTRL